MKRFVALKTPGPELRGRRRLLKRHDIKRRPKRLSVNDTRELNNFVAYLRLNPPRRKLRFYAMCGLRCPMTVREMP